MVSIEVFVILAVGTLDLAIVPWRVGTNELMADASLFETRLEQAGTVVAGEQTFGELSAIVRLNAKNLERRSLDQVFQKLGGGIGAMLLKGFQIPPTSHLRRFRRCRTLEQISHRFEHARPESASFRKVLGCTWGLEA